MRGRGPRRPLRVSVQPAPDATVALRSTSARRTRSSVPDQPSARHPQCRRGDHRLQYRPEPTRAGGDARQASFRPARRRSARGTQIFITDRAWVATPAAPRSTPAASPMRPATARSPSPPGPTSPPGTVVSARISGGNVTFTVNGVDTAPVAPAASTSITRPATRSTSIRARPTRRPASSSRPRFADGNTTFNGSLVNTGLTVGVNAIAIAARQRRLSRPDHRRLRAFPQWRAR